MRFTHLHTHSHYSLLDGLQKIPELLDRVKELGMDSVALTDHGTLTGIIDFYNEAKKKEVKAIIGVETYMAPRLHTDKMARIDANPYHLILLAYNHQGYQNLMRLISISHLEGYYYKPRIDRELLSQYNEGLIALSACASGEVGSFLSTGQYDKARETAMWYREVFGPDRYYLELQDHAHQWDTQRKINTGLLDLAKDTDTKLVITADSHYARHGDREAHEVLLCVQTGKKLDDPNRMSMDMDLYVSDPKDILARWSHMPEVLSNTAAIADMCSVELDLGKILIPKFDVPEGVTEREYLHQLVFQGTAAKYCSMSRTDAAKLTKEEIIPKLPQRVLDRLNYELDVVGRMGYDGYFLIVADFINWGKAQGIIFGPGRGSAAGSIVSYAMNITELDPLRYDLLFERFLNPDRISMPDIDVDIQDTRRQEVIDYVVEKYGEKRVAQIITFGTMAARNAIRDAARVLGVAYGDADRIAKLVPPPIQGKHIPLKKSIKDDPDLKKEYQSNPATKRVIDLAARLEGTIRSHGVHAAGVVIAPDDIVNFAPLQRAQKGGVATQYSMNPIEQIGLLKMDFLGLSNLSIINTALRIIKRLHGVEIDISTLPLEDAPTFELLSRGDTTGVFQLESAGMKRYLRDLKPTVFDDIIAMVALYRPGPMQWIDDFIARKHGKKKIEYLHPLMESALKSTYGVLVYQEQVMQIAKDLCGFGGGEADTLRKAIGKKQISVMAKMKEQFIAGAIKNGADKKKMEDFWLSLEDFAAYCFNKSHAACYGMIAYETAYLKAHYPTEFMAALLTSDYGNTDRIAIEIEECRQMGLAVLPPDVNESFDTFGVVPEENNTVFRTIRYGLLAIKNMGEHIVETIITERKKGGHFTSLEDFLTRVKDKDLNKKSIESLIKTGALDRFGDRGTLLGNTERILQFHRKVTGEENNGQSSLFGESFKISSLQLEEMPPMDPRQKLTWEKELLGIYVSEHPLQSLQAVLQNFVISCKAAKEAPLEKNIRTCGIITTVKKIYTKKNDPMLFVKIEDLSDTIEVIVFPKTLEATQNVWNTDTIVAVEGRVNRKDGETTIICNTAKEVTNEMIQKMREHMASPDAA